MDLSFQAGLAENYSSASQKIRVLSESWVATQVYCPNCGREKLRQYQSNRPVADFSCSTCHEDYELKSKKGVLRKKIVDGAYSSMMERLIETRNPNLFLLSYDLRNLTVVDFLIVPKHFFIPETIERRKPLSLSARRAGWIGCNILLDAIPEAGRIFLIRNRAALPREDVLSKWRQTLFLREQTNINKKGWLLNVLRCVERIRAPIFQISDVYGYEDELRAIYPANKHVKEKMRQQLQVLRDRGLVEFVGRGKYRMAQRTLSSLPLVFISAVAATWAAL